MKVASSGGVDVIRLLDVMSRAFFEMHGEGKAVHLCRAPNEARLLS